MALRGLWRADAGTVSFPVKQSVPRETVPRGLLAAGCRVAGPNLRKKLRDLCPRRSRRTQACFGTSTDPSISNEQRRTGDLFTVEPSLATRRLVGSDPRDPCLSYHGASRERKPSVVSSTTFGTSYGERRAPTNLSAGLVKPTRSRDRPARSPRACARA